jgi:hypothetical protein
MFKAIWQKIKVGYNSYREVAEILDSSNFDLEGRIQDAIEETETTGETETRAPHPMTSTVIPGTTFTHWHGLRKRPITLIRTDENGEQHIVTEYRDEDGEQHIVEEETPKAFKNKKRRLDI